MRTYEEMVTFILEIPKFTTKNKPEHTVKLLELLGNPQERFKVIHVAGSNGKGSVCAYIDSVLRQAGKKTGLFTSPHCSLAANASITALTSGRAASYTTGTCFFKIPAFSAAISDIVSPKISVCSRLTEVITVRIGFFTTLVASSLPPRPVSITAYSTF